MSSRLFRFRPDIPFSKDDTNRFLPWIIGFIVFITTMMTASGLGLYSVVRSSHQARADIVSVHIPVGVGINNAEQLAINVTATLRQIDGVKKVNLVPPSDIQELIKPWVGDDITSELIPFPRIIEVTLADPRPDMNALRERVMAVAPQAEIDDHAEWIAQYATMLSAMQWSLWIAAGLFIVTMLAIVVLTTRASIKIHQRVIHILHTVGAFDSYIAKQFQFNSFLVAGKGALTGSFIALLFYTLLCVLTSGKALALLPAFKMGVMQLALFLLMPLMVGLGALYSSRLTVLAQLQRMP